MNKYLILHYGFERPTPEQMSEWNKWFESISDRQLDRGHFPSGHEFSADGSKAIPFGRDSITGFTMIEAANMEEAVALAADCPFVDCTRVYEVKSG